MEWSGVKADIISSLYARPTSPPHQCSHSHTHTHTHTHTRKLSAHGRKWGLNHCEWMQGHLWSGHSMTVTCTWRIKFKSLMLAYRVLDGSAPTYLNALVRANV